jgi:hypothetical protein
MEWLADFVEKHLTFTGKCYGHCDKPTAAKVLSQDSNHVISAYVCPNGVVSHLVNFSLKPDLAWFQVFLSRQVGEENVKDRDLRLATRHGWELGNGAEEEIQSQLGPAGAIKQVYWRRYPATDEEKDMLVALCVGNDSKTGCLTLFMKRKESNERLCPACRTTQTMNGDSR